MNSNLSFANQDKNIAFQKFTNEKNFIAINKDRLILQYSNCKTYKRNGRISYKEIKLLLNQDEVLDINEHHDFLNDYQSENFSLPYYSISIWNWYKTVAFKTKNTEFISNYIQSVKRRNMVVPKQLISDILSYNKIHIYLHQDKSSNNKMYYGKFIINEKVGIDKCFNIKY